MRLEYLSANISKRFRESSVLQLCSKKHLRSPVDTNSVLHNIEPGIFKLSIENKTPPYELNHLLSVLEKRIETQSNDLLGM